MHKKDLKNHLKEMKKDITFVLTVIHIIQQVKMTYLEEGEVVDTYRGNYTYRDLWYELEDGKMYFYEKYYGYNSSETERITDANDVIKIRLEYEI